jgi:hypothetical protein
MKVQLPDGTEYTVGTLLGKGDSNFKLSKSDNSGKGYLTYGLSLAPSKSSGYNTCPNASPGCAAACLFTAGMGVFKNVQAGRIAKTKAFFEHRQEFLLRLKSELVSANKRAKKLDKHLAVRLNVLSDIKWEAVCPSLFSQFPDVQLYDYTKNVGRMFNYLSGKFPPNYHLTFSRSEINEKECLEILKMGGNVTVVFDSLPSHWNGYPVWDGDQTDLRFLDPKGHVIGLKMKGQAKKDKTGFVVNLL